MSPNRRRNASWWRRAADVLGEEPEPFGPTRLIYHGARVGLLLLTAVVIYLLFPAPRVPDAAVLERGEVAPHDVIAEFTFTIPKPPDELLREQVQAASGVPPVLDEDPSVLPGVEREVIAFFAGLDSVTAGVDTAARAAGVRLLMERARLSPTPASVEILSDSARRVTLERSVLEALRDVYPRGIAPASLAEGVTTVRVRMADGAERIVPRDSLVTPERFFDLAARRLPEAEGRTAELERLVLIRFARPNLAYNEEQTEAARVRARAAVVPERARVLRGEKIVGAHEQVGAAEEERLEAYQAELTRRARLHASGEHTAARVLGGILFNALVLLVLGLLVFFYRRPLYGSWRSLLLLTLLVLCVMGSGAVIARLSLPSELIPVTFAALIVAVLWDGRFGLSISLLLALLVGGQTPFLGVAVPFTAALGGSAAAFSVGSVQRRSRSWVSILLISLAYLAAAVTLGLLRSRALDAVAISMGWGMANAVIASLLAIGVLPLLERFTGITTDQTLLELSDLNGTLLKRLSLEAPGTYAHTVNVANLAEAASNAIGANGLLARVGAYYHDIGKLVKPQYFIENQPRGRNPHDKLKPAMSSSIIRSHVLEGLKLAEAAKIPETIRRFIPEHHGTQQISFFYNRAREVDPDGHLNPGDFSYPGPKPQIKETAILMLSDAVESAARALQDPTPARIRELVERLVTQKIAEGQLDQSPLTLREIDIIKDTLSNVLTGMYHHRIDYPAPPVVAPVELPVGADAVNLPNG